MTLVIVTGAFGSGKTAIAEAIEVSEPSITVFRFDSIGVPSTAVMATFGDGHQPGGAWQRAVTFRWMERIAPIVSAGKPVLFEGQMRIAFIRDALVAFGIKESKILLLDCDDATRRMRLTHDRLQPELATENMMAWSRFLRQESLEASCEILDTTSLSLAESVWAVLSIIQAHRE